MKKTVVLAVSTIALSLLAAACKEEVVTGPGFVCDVTNPVRDLSIGPANSVVLVRSPARETDTLQLHVQATNRNGNARFDVPITFSSSDSTIATVDSVGLVHARKPGSITVKASTCGKTATTRVTVVAAVVTVKIKADTLTIVVGDSVLVTARAIGQTGDTLSDVKFKFAVSPSSSATIKTASDSTSAYVFATSPGTLTVTATGEGSNASVAITVLPRSFLSGTATAGTIDAGGSYTCGLISTGRGYCWGLNDHKQLGAVSDSVCFSNTDTRTDTLENAPATAVKACSLLPLRLAPTVAFATISAGDSSACGISTTGRAYCWGTNIHGELGNGSLGLRGIATLVTSALNFTSISTGGGHTCAIAVGGTGYCWGQDSLGQLGDARLINSSTPIPVSGGGGPAIFSTISAGGRHTCALLLDGTAFCWGSNDSSQLGVGSTGGIADTPAQVTTGTRFTSISSGRDHTCAIAVGGAAFCWGSNAFGQLGTGAIGAQSPVPVAVAGGLSFARISAGYSHTCGLTTGGAVYCWGENRDLQLGRGPATGSSVADGTPVQVSGGGLPAGVTFTTVTAGAAHSCGVGSDGFAYCWGSNVFGALGNTLQAAFRGFPQRVATP